MENSFASAVASLSEPLVRFLLRIPPLDAICLMQKAVQALEAERHPSDATFFLRGVVTMSISASTARVVDVSAESSDEAKAIKYVIGSMLEVLPIVATEDLFVHVVKKGGAFGFKLEMSLWTVLRKHYYDIWHRDIEASDDALWTELNNLFTPFLIDKRNVVELGRIKPGRVGRLCVLQMVVNSAYEALEDSPGMATPQGLKEVHCALKTLAAKFLKKNAFYLTEVEQRSVGRGDPHGVLCLVHHNASAWMDLMGFSEKSPDGSLTDGSVSDFVQFIGGSLGGHAEGLKRVWAELSLHVPLADNIEQVRVWEGAVVSQLQQLMPLVRATASIANMYRVQTPGGAVFTGNIMKSHPPTIAIPQEFGTIYHYLPVRGGSIKAVDEGLELDVRTVVKQLQGIAVAKGGSCDKKHSQWHLGQSKKPSASPASPSAGSLDGSAGACGRLSAEAGVDGSQLGVLVKEGSKKDDIKPPLMATEEPSTDSSVSSLVGGQKPRSDSSVCATVPSGGKKQKKNLADMRSIPE
mmetsp:Transcript_30946/g.89988  ORF Transcript_30946/g.89988 Transcript_30946/m.89988 type:complete len:522 (+) Transcript_30946:1507-3072(+)